MKKKAWDWWTHIKCNAYKPEKRPSIPNVVIISVNELIEISCTVKKIDDMKDHKKDQIYPNRKRNSQKSEKGKW